MTELPNGDHLSVGEIQSFHRKLDEDKGFDHDPVRNVAYFVEELGEVARAIRRIERGLDDPERLKSDLAEELADCLAYVAKLANYYEIDLEAAYIRKMRENVSRTWKPKE